MSYERNADEALNKSLSVYASEMQKIKREGVGDNDGFFELAKRGDTLEAYGFNFVNVHINDKGEITAKDIEPERFYISTAKE